MARNFGDIPLSSNIEVKKAAPLDARAVVLTKAELLLLSTWNSGDGNAYVYKGMIVSVVNDGVNNGIYTLKETDYTVEANWEKSSSLGYTAENVANKEVSGLDSSTIKYPCNNVVKNEIDFLKHVIALTNNPTGFDPSDETVIINGNSTNRTVALSGSGWKAYYNNVENTTIVNGYVSPAHLNDILETYFLYYDGSTISWIASADLPTNFFEYLLIAIAWYDGTNWVYQRENHGLKLSGDAHKIIHRTIGTHRLSGGTLADFKENSTVVAERRPSISACRIADEDCESGLPLLPAGGLYTRLKLSGANATPIFTKDATDMVSLLVNRPYYNQFVGGAWTDTLMSNNNYATLFILALPMASDVNSQKLRFVIVQPQSQSGDLATQQALDIKNINLGSLSNLASEFVGIIKVIIRYTNNYIIISAENIKGTKIEQTTGASGLYLSSIAVNSKDLAGDGSAGSPLNITTVYDGAGVIEEPVITIADANNGIINIAGGTFALYDNVNKTDKPYTYSGGNQNLTLIDGSNYIYINYNSGTPIFGRTNDFTVINNSSIVLVGYIFKDGINVFPYKFYYKASASVKGITNNIQSRLYNTDKYRIESGLTLSTSGSSILIAAGYVWIGDNKITLGAYNSSIDSANTYVWYFTNGAWTYLANVTSIFNSTYQGATSTVGLTNGKYAVNWIFRIIEKDIPNNTYLNKIFIFLGRGDYTIEQAEAESLYSLYNNAPIIPNYILERGILVGKIISLTNSSIGTVISKYNQNAAIDNTLKGDFNDVKNPLGVDLNNLYKELPLTEASSISWDLATTPRASINLTANRILANPTNGNNGTEYIISIKQESTPYNLTFDTNYKWKDGIVPTLSTTNGAVDLLIFYYSQGFMLGTIKRYMTI